MGKKSKKLGYETNISKVYDKCSPLRGSPESRSSHRMITRSPPMVEIIHDRFPPEVTTHVVERGPPVVTQYIEHGPPVVSQYSPVRPRPGRN